MIDLEALDRCLKANPKREIVLSWIIEEWDRYSNKKWNFTGDKVDDNYKLYEEAMRADGFKNTSFWPRQIFQYLDRAALFGVGEPGSEVPEKGRQAAMKMATTLIDSLACMIRNHGLPPAPGDSTAELQEWKP